MLASFAAICVLSSVRSMASIDDSAASKRDSNVVVSMAAMASVFALTASCMVATAASRASSLSSTSVSSYAAPPPVLALASSSQPAAKVRIRAARPNRVNMVFLRGSECTPVFYSVGVFYGDVSGIRTSFRRIGGNALGELYWA